MAIVELKDGRVVGTFEELVRFCAKFRVCPDTGCWLWTAGKNGDGYGNHKFRGKNMGAHRVAFLLFVGPVPAKHHVDHVYEWGCRSKACVNPNHLEAVTQRENIRRAVVLRPPVTNCPAGHAYAEHGARWGARNNLYCVACQRPRDLARKNAAYRKDKPWLLQSA